MTQSIDSLSSLKLSQSIAQFKLPNDFKFLVKNRHVDRDFDVVIKLKEADSVKIMDDLKGSSASVLLLTNAGQKDMKADEKLKAIQKVDIMKRIFDEFNDDKSSFGSLQQTPQSSKGKVK